MRTPASVSAIRISDSATSAPTSTAAALRAGLRDSSEKAATIETTVAA